ncbi:pteridine reductase [Cellvibrio sp. UBA7661]|uniref:pteridine reductase n=1 Tax=Cellvibrio sp. UBA7661 TaxID=1946311 RepID=UPI002F3533A3
MSGAYPKVALVTGAAKRIGAEIARKLHAANFNIIAHYHQSKADAEELAEELNEKRSESAISIQADLNDMSQVMHLAQAGSDAWQKIDLLVNNASSFFPTPIGKTDEEEWNQIINSNLKAPFFLAQALAPTLAKHHGCIINIADIYADKPLKKHSVYSIAKAGNVMLTKTLALELAPLIRVNGIAPGAILWPDDSYKKPEDQLSDENKQKMLAKIPLQERGHESDIARTILFLANEAPYMTGQILNVDGGRSITI